ncbi:MAG: pyruvate formate lyase family protein [Myxococcales bacterium]
MESYGANIGATLLLRFMALSYNHRPSLRRYLYGVDGPLDLTIGVRTETGSVAQTIRFRDGKARVLGGSHNDTDATLVFQDNSVIRQMLTAPPSELLLLLLKGRMRMEGNLGHLSLFNYLLSVLIDKTRLRPLPVPPKNGASSQARPVPNEPTPKSVAHRPPSQRVARLTTGRVDDVRWLDEPFLARYTLADFPRLTRFLAEHFDTVPELCAERPLLLTRYFRQHGFEHDSQGHPHVPVLRQAQAVAHLLAHKVPIIRDGDLLAGTTTACPVGVVLYPDAHALMIWGELGSVSGRALNPYRVTQETAELLHHEVFPFWLHRSFREWVRHRHGQPLCQQLDERFAVYFSWKTVALSHTVPDFPRLLRLGTTGLTAEIDEELARLKGDDEKRHTLTAMRLSLDGLVAYARNLAAQARREAAKVASPDRSAELVDIARLCEQVPQYPARTLHEALQSIWLGWIALHMENTNAGLSLGRLDQWLQPYFDADMALLATPAERTAYVQRAIELVGCFYLRCADHLPLVPDIGNYLFGGSSSDQAITLGGVTPDGKNGVNDMTYVLLKVTELLRLRDPNVNARHNLAHNSDDYLRRLCEVNLVTAATPSMHGDESVMRSLVQHGYAASEVRDWSATGCVEPTLSGSHMGHTGSTMFNLVAPLEMALDDGRHPLMRWSVGPRTGAPERGVLPTFEDFYAAYEAQLAFLTHQAVTYNNLLGEAHAQLRPTPLLSSLLRGPLRKGRDVTRGGAEHNTSGVACIGLADVVDSLQAIRILVYEQRICDFAELKAALRDDFVGHDVLLAHIERRVAKFGSGDQAALDLANRVARRVHDGFTARSNFRGGKYTTGFWSMSNHVAFGGLTGALPSGRRAGKAFTPGLTPSPRATDNLLDNLRDVASLDPTSMDNNIAFNIKFMPAASTPDDDGHARAVDPMHAYVKTYFELGGMQMQLNVVSSAMLRDAMAHPECYRDLLVRISGYNAYFVTLNPEMQIELIERAEYQ